VIEKRRVESEMIEVLKKQNAEISIKIRDEKVLLEQKLEPIHKIEEE
jgi:hypothetical protein